MNFFEMIPQATKDMVHILAARGLPHSEIGVLTHLDEETVTRILAEPHDPIAPELIGPVEGPVNTTLQNK